MANADQEQLRAALAWASDDYDRAKAAGTNTLTWLWEVIQGDFNDNASTAQALTAAGIGALPLVGQVCSMRDLIADCNRLRHEPDNAWYWSMLVLTLIGLFPSLGALVKGVLGVFFGLLRRMGVAATGRAIDVGMGWLISYLRRRNVQTYIARLRIDDIFGWSADQVRKVKGMVTVRALTAAFDAGLAMLESLSAKVSLIPTVGARAKAVVEQVRRVRDAADTHLARALAPVQELLDRIALRLEHEALKGRRGILNAHNVHFQGGLPEDAAVAIMREREPLPVWLSRGAEKEWPQAVMKDYATLIQKSVKERWPSLTEDNVKSFHTLAADEIHGPARLYRVIAPGSRAMSDCWVSEAVFKQLQGAADPRSAWRRYLAVWPDWNVNGQFVIYDIKRGESLKFWRGPTSSQVKAELLDRHLEGGWEQIVFNVERSSPLNDTMAYYKVDSGPAHVMRDGIDQAAYYKLGEEERKAYTPVREKINHPNISGPFETGWGYTDFDGAGFGDKIGLPHLPGQITTLKE